MCLNTESVEALHALTSELKAEHERKAAWLADYDKRDGGDGTNGIMLLDVTRPEAERIFADRIAAHEARLKELGWTRTIRVEPTERTPSQTPMRELVEKV